MPKAANQNNFSKTKSAQTKNKKNNVSKSKSKIDSKLQKSSNISDRSSQNINIESILEGKIDQKLQRVNTIINILKELYPQAKCALNFADPLQLLVATILSAQCTDERVNEVTKELFKKYKKLEDYAQADFETFAQEIKSTGFYKNKAKNIISCCQQILTKYNGKIPQTIKELTTLPGVGRKTANVVLSNAFGIAEGIVVDTHVARVSKRMGLTQNNDPDKIEEDLMKIVLKEDWIVFAHLLIFHGRNRCKARKPDCNNCEVAKYCPKIL